MVAENESAALGALEECKTILLTLLSSREGRVFNTAGDAILAEFTSPLNAVLFAVECQAAFHKRNSVSSRVPMRWRMGLNLGEVSVQPSGDLLGDGVNIASRLESVADHGGIALGPEIYGVVHRKMSGVEFENRGRIELKNIPDPIEVWAIKVAGAIRTSQQPVKRGPSREELHKLVESLEEKARQLNGEAALSLGKMLSEPNSPIQDLNRAFMWLWVARGLRVEAATDLLNLLIPSLSKSQFDLLKMDAEVFFDEVKWHARNN